MNLLDQNYRAKLIEDIKKPYNVDRKSQSLYRTDIQNDKIKPHILDELRKQLYDSTVKEMPIISTINIQKKVVAKKGCIYSEGVIRSFDGLSEDQEEKVLAVYADGKANSELHKCNKKLIYEHQTIMGVLPRKGKLAFKKFELHQVDAIPSMLDPEIADGFILSVFDKEDVTQSDSSIQNSATNVTPTKDKFQGDKPSEDTEIASKDQYRKYLERYIVWDRNYNFIMNGEGSVIDLGTNEPMIEVSESDILNPLAPYGIIPYFDISHDKDGEFWNTQGSSLSDFTVQFNSMLSDLANNCKMNGYSVAIVKAGSDFNPSTLVVGASQLIHLPNDGENETSFEFASPDSSISEISDTIDKLLNYFITTENLDSSAINSTGAGQQYNSGWDRFLAMTEKRESNKEDYGLFKDAEENELWAIVRAWLNVLTGNELLDSKYHTGQISDDVTMKIVYENEKAILTDKEKLENAQTRKDLDIDSRKTLLMKVDGLTSEEADEHLKLVDDSKTKALDNILD